MTQSFRDRWLAQHTLFVAMMMITGEEHSEEPVAQDSLTWGIPAQPETLESWSTQTYKCSMQEYQSLIDVHHHIAIL